MTEKNRTILVRGSVFCGKTLYLENLAEFYRKQGKKVVVVGKSGKNGQRKSYGGF